MKSDCFAIMILLVTAASTAISMTVNEQSVRPLHPPSEPIGLLPRASGSIMGASAARVMESKHSEDGSEGCLTEEMCMKKWIICSKNCDVPGDRVEANHFGGKCTIKCKKCIPNC